MNEELQKALAEMITQFTGALGGAADFALPEAPEVITQLLLWKSTIGLAGFVLGLILICASLFALHKRLAWKAPASKTPDDPEVGFLELCTKSSDFSTRFHAENLALALKRKINFPEVVVYPDWLFLVSAAFGIPGIIFACTGLDWLQIWLAPKVYLIEYTANLAGGN